MHPDPSSAVFSGRVPEHVILPSSCAGGGVAPPESVGGAAGGNVLSSHTRLDVPSNDA